MTPDQFVWMPYDGFNEEPRAYMHSNVWTTNTAMVCFQMVEWHHADRVMLQFGLVQNKPDPPIDLTRMHNLTMQGQCDLDWEVYHSSYIALWNDRLNSCVVGRRCHGRPVHNEQYMRWFLRNSRPFLSADLRLNDPRNILPVVDEQDEEEVSPPITTQTQRRERNRARQQRGRQTQEMPQTFQGSHEYGQSSSQTPQQYPYGQQSDEFVPHRHSISHQEPFSQHTPFETPHQYQYGQQSEDYVPQRHSISHPEPFEDPHRHSTSEWNTNQETDWFGVGLGAHEHYSHLALLQQQLAGSSSSTVPQFIPEEPLPAPEEEQQPPNRRPRRVPKPKKCGTGGHLLR